MCNLENFLQLNMCQELPLFAFVYTCLAAGCLFKLYYYYYYYYYVVVVVVVVVSFHRPFLTGTFALEPTVIATAQTAVLLVLRVAF
jgi:hypothetical protein